MKKIIEKKQYCRMVICLILFLMCVVVFFSTASNIVFAESVLYTNVLDDLRNDETFDVSFYPRVENDYSLKVIQVAETQNKEVLLYVYQPSGQLSGVVASSVNIALSDSENLKDFTNYKLTLINSSGVFYKYRVEGLKVSNEYIRYYTITSIYRPFNSAFGDKQAEGGNKITEVEFNVSKEFKFKTENGVVFQDCLDIETIEITDKFVGFVRYWGGFRLFVGSDCDAHFVAFSTDKPMSRLLEAEVYFTTQGWSETHSATGSISFQSVKDNYRTLTYKEKVEFSGNGLGADTFKWDRIQTVEEFLASVESENIYSDALVNVRYGTVLSSSAKKAIEKQEWVLNFYESAYNLSESHMGWYSDSGTLVGNVSILRLKFETDGFIYNLGVIDNKQSGSDKPVNQSYLDIELTDTFKWILIAVVIIVLLFLLGPLLPYIAKFILAVISFPFKALKSISKAHKRRKSKKERKQDKPNIKSSKDSKQAETTLKCLRKV